MSDVPTKHCKLAFCTSRLNFSVSILFMVNHFGIRKQVRKFMVPGICNVVFPVRFGKTDQKYPVRHIESFMLLWYKYPCSGYLVKNGLLPPKLLSAVDHLPLAIVKSSMGLIACHKATGSLTSARETDFSIISDRSRAEEAVWYEKFLKFKFTNFRLSGVGWRRKVDRSLSYNVTSWHTTEIS